MAAAIALAVGSAACLPAFDGGTGSDGSVDGMSGGMSSGASSAMSSGGDAAMLDASRADGNADATTDDGSATGAPADSGSDAPCGDACTVCTDGATRCSFNGVETCSAGSWAAAIPCPATAPDCVDGGCGQPPSCQESVNGTANCGPGGSGNETCCSSLEVPAGSYNRTYTNSGSGATGQADPASVSGFRLDKYLVTVGRFRQYVDYLTSSVGAPPPAGSGKHVHLNGGLGLANVGDGGAAFEQGWDATDWNADIPTGAGAAATWNANLTSSAAFDSPTFATWTASPASNENLPINVLTWYEAYAFCIWDGGFLPSEAEWEFVAAAGNQQRQYPWGTTDPSTGTGSEYAIYGCFFPSGADGTCTNVSSIAPVGTPSLGAGFWGQLDMAGEVYQWTLDWLAPFADPCSDCANLAPATDQVIRGGYWGFGATHLVPWDRSIFSEPTTRDTAVGVRCARAP